MKGEISGLGAVEVSVDELRQLAKDLGRGISSLARGTRKAVQPQYGECANGLHQIATILRNCVWNITKTYNDFVYFSFDKHHALAELKLLCRPFIDRAASEIAYDMKFNCGRIDSIYTTNCERTLMTIYAKVVKTPRRKRMQRALQQMKRHDAEMIKHLVEAVIEPIAAFARETLKMDDPDQARKLHAKLVRRIEGKVEKAEQILAGLDQAVRSFADLAKTPLRPVTKQPSR